MRGPSRATSCGFSLIEMVIVISISAILATVTTGFITGPFAAYNDVAARARLVGQAEGALGRMGREIRRALPNSLRVSGNALELYHTADGARYRDAPGFNDDSATLHLAPFDTLEFILADTSFDVFGRFQSLPAAPSVLPLGYRVSVYPHNTAQIWSDAATNANPGLLTPGTTLVSLLDRVDEDQIVLSAAHQFPHDSPGNRLFVVDTPISYLCDPGPGTLTRYSGYAPSAAQPTLPGVAPLSGAATSLAARDVSACSFSYTPGPGARSGLITLSLTLARGGETVRLLHQIHVGNAP